jgi:hypothetical protein
MVCLNEDLIAPISNRALTLGYLLLWPLDYTDNYRFYCRGAEAEVPAAAGDRI